MYRDRILDQYETLINSQKFSTDGTKVPSWHFCSRLFALKAKINSCSFSILYPNSKKKSYKLAFKLSAIDKSLGKPNPDIAQALCKILFKTSNPSKTGN